MNKVKESESRNSPAFDDTPRGRKAKKGKAKAMDPPFDGTPLNGKRKRGKAMSVTPSVDEEEPEDRDAVSILFVLGGFAWLTVVGAQKRRKMKGVEIPPAMKEKMKKAYNDCYKAVLNAEHEGRRRCELFKELPDKKVSNTAILPSSTMAYIASQLYPDYYEIIKQPIAMSTIRKRITSNYYKSAVDFREDWRLMFNNARTYNQEGSWVYKDAEEMEKVFDATFDRVVAGTDIPGAPPAAAAPAGPAYEAALTPMDDDERPPLVKSKSGRKQVLSDDEYLTPSDEE